MPGFSDYLSIEEGEAAERDVRELQSCQWARPLLATIENGGGPSAAKMSFIFELRFAAALHRAGVKPSYEQTGAGRSRIDFGIETSGRRFHVELLRLGETAAARAATTTETVSSGITLSIFDLDCKNDDPKKTEPAEVLKVVQRICQKIERNGEAHKFTAAEGEINILLVDIRTFLEGLSDGGDYLQIALGGTKWNQGNDTTYLGRTIEGVFHPENTMKGARIARERLHFIAFANEETYEPGDLVSSMEFVANPLLFDSAEAARSALEAWPLNVRFAEPLVYVPA